VGLRGDHTRANAQEAVYRKKGPRVGLARVIGRVCHDGVYNDRVEQIEPQCAGLAAEVMRFGGDWQDELHEEQTRCSDPQFGIWNLFPSRSKSKFFYGSMLLAQYCALLT
jgi:hypothetical protein